MARVPRWTPDPDRFPRFALLRAPSPLHHLPRLSAAIGHEVDVWIKREDLLPLAFGGNKLRNLEFLVGAALQAGADTLVTSGRRWSNHARLTAAAGAVAGLPVHVVLSGPPTDPPGPGVRMDRLLGATVHQAVTDDRLEREQLVDQVVSALEASGRRPYVIDVGGSGVTGVVGQVLAAQELLDDTKAYDLEIDGIVLPSATGGTQAGLLAGLAAAGSSVAVRGVTVARPGGELRPRIEAGLAAFAQASGLPAVPAAAIHLDDEALGPGYGSPTRAAEEATHLLASTEGILLDPIYTAKGLAGLVAMVGRGELDGRRIVFWHSGGGPGLFEPLDDLPAG